MPKGDKMSKFLGGLFCGIVFMGVVLNIAEPRNIFGMLPNHKDTITKLQKELKQEVEINEVLYLENKVLANEVVLRQDITSVIVDASRSYNIDPLLLARVIRSESNFRPDPKHSLPQVKGPGGINSKVHTKLKHNTDSYVGNIYASAEVLSMYMEDSDSLTLAITRYKGLSPLGLQQAKSILKEYLK